MLEKINKTTELRNRIATCKGMAGIFHKAKSIRLENRASNERILLMRDNGYHILSICHLAMVDMGSRI